MMNTAYADDEKVRLERWLDGPRVVSVPTGTPNHAVGIGGRLQMAYREVNAQARTCLVDRKWNGGLVSTALGSPRVLPLGLAGIGGSRRGLIRREARCLSRAANQCVRCLPPFSSLGSRS